MRYSIECGFFWLKAANKFTIVSLWTRISEESHIWILKPMRRQNRRNVGGYLSSAADIIVKGAVTDVNNIRPADLKKQYSEYVTILGVTDNRRAPHSKHWKVVGA